MTGEAGLAPSSACDWTQGVAESMYGYRLEAAARFFVEQVYASES